ncbi:MAG TPA: hypothetical protein VFP83_07040 [Candidatus Limnocylindria bacterium]|nr:hypothetical protein [Candidatus Limnocylindria bacterium]
MSDELEALLRLVAEGRLTPEEAAPLVAALTERSAPPPSSAVVPASGRVLDAGARQLRIRVEERGRTVVNLRVPLSVAETALNMVPGLAGEQAARVRAALEGGTIGPIIDVEDPDGDAVMISLE